MRAHDEQSKPNPTEVADSPADFWIPDALRPGRDCWRVENAERAAVLVDAEAYFCALRAAMLKAEHSIHIVGWDVDRRMPFPGCAADVARLEVPAPANGPEIAADGYPLQLGDFLGSRGNGHVRKLKGRALEVTGEGQRPRHNTESTEQHGRP